MLAEFAAKYVWWKTPETAMRYPTRIIAQVMDLGTFQDMQSLFDTLGVARLAEVIRQAEPGWFSPRSWHYWHFRLGLAEIGKIPPLPVRHIP